jgi:HSP20 family protein
MCHRVGTRVRTKSAPPLIFKGLLLARILKGAKSLAPPVEGRRQPQRRPKRGRLHGLSSHLSAILQLIERITAMNTTLSRWNPMRELEDFQQRILSAFRPGERRGNGQETLTEAEWMPLVDIVEDDKEYIITAELPEVSKNDVKVTMENGLLTLRGERKFERDDENKRYHRLERYYGAFARSFAMPDDGDPSSVRAEFKDGILRIRIAKSESARPRQIEVKVG